MKDLVIAAVLGVVEGLTEFLPVSSTGHLILAGHWLSFTGEKASTFEVFIQSGAILAVFFFYLDTFRGLFDLKAKEGFKGGRGLFLLGLTTAPGLLAGFLAHDFIKEKLFSPSAVAIGLAVGGVWILLTEHFLRRKGREGLNQLTVKDALVVGCFQCLALWPGMSRAASTILGGMMLGLQRQTATEYSFFAAVPLLTAAAALDLLKSLKLLQLSDLPVFFTGFAVSFVSAWFTLKFFIHFVSRHDLKLFGWYRIALAILVLWLI